MKYYNANLVFPDFLVKELQKYIQGEYIYIPIQQNCRKNWGEISGYRREIQKRNMNIIEEYKNGVSLEKIADSYFLSISAVRKIVYER